MGKLGRYSYFAYTEGGYPFGLLGVLHDTVDEFPWSETERENAEKSVRGVYPNAVVYRVTYYRGEECVRNVNW